MFDNLPLTVSWHADNEACQFDFQGLQSVNGHRLCFLPIGIT